MVCSCFSGSFNWSDIYIDGDDTSSLTKEVLPAQVIFSGFIGVDRFVSKNSKINENNNVRFSP